MRWIAQVLDDQDEQEASLHDSGLREFFGYAHRDGQPERASHARPAMLRNGSLLYLRVQDRRDLQAFEKVAVSPARRAAVAPTPFALTEGTTGQRTVIVPSGTPPPPGLVAVGSVVRVEAERLLVGYSFDLTTNTLTGRYVPNPAAGKSHAFTAYRIPATSLVPVSMKQGDIELEEEDDDET